MILTHGTNSLKRSIIIPPNLVLLNYFNKQIGELPTQGSVLNYVIDNTCPLNIDGGAPCCDNSDIYNNEGDYTHGLEYKSSNVTDVITSGNFTFEYFSKVMGYSDRYKDKEIPTLGIYRENNDFWLCSITQRNNAGSNDNRCWFNDASYQFAKDHGWHHYEVGCENGSAVYFVDGEPIYTAQLNLSNGIFRISKKRTERGRIRFAQVALWDRRLHDTGFTVSYKPIAY